MLSKKIMYPGDPEIARQRAAGVPEKKIRVFRADQLAAITRLNTEMDTGSLSALIGAGLGSGKTVIAAEVILEIKRKLPDPDALRVLVVGVKDAYSQWNESLACQSDGLVTVRRIDRTKAGQAARDDFMASVPGVYYSGLEMLRAGDWKTELSAPIEMDASLKALWGEIIPDVADPEKKRVQRRVYTKIKKPLDLIISDESHRHATRGTAGLKTVKTIPTVRKIAMSGTFYGDKFENAWGTGRWLWPEARDATMQWIVNPNFKMFLKQYAIVKQVLSKAGKPVKTPSGMPVTKVIGERVPGAFVRALPCYVFIKTPVGPVPPSEIVQVTLDGEQARQYREMEKQSLAHMKDVSGNSAALVADLPVTQRQRLRTATLGEMTLVPVEGEDDEGNPLPDTIMFSPGCKSAVLNAAYKVLHRPTWVGKKALILTHSKSFAIETARRIESKYPGQVAMKTGDTKDWDAQKARFREPLTGASTDLLYIVAVISAVGTATDGLQDECAKVLWLSEDDWETANIQGSNRIWRLGVDLDEYESVKIVPMGTVAEDVIANNEKKKSGILSGVELHDPKEDEEE